MSSKDDNQAVSIRVMDKEYLVGCPEEERDELQASARYLDVKMREIRDSGKVIGADRIAVMAALNLAHELLTQDKQDSGKGEGYTQRLRKLQDKIESALLTASNWKSREPLIKPGSGADCVGKKLEMLIYDHVNYAFTFLSVWSSSS